MPGLEPRSFSDEHCQNNIILTLTWASRGGKRVATKRHKREVQLVRTTTSVTPRSTVQSAMKRSAQSGRQQRPPDFGDFATLRVMMVSTFESKTHPRKKEANSFMEESQSWYVSKRNLEPVAGENLHPSLKID